MPQTPLSVRLSVDKTMLALKSDEI